jgi:hypothetical protein
MSKAGKEGIGAKLPLSPADRDARAASVPMATSRLSNNSFRQSSRHSRRLQNAISRNLFLFGFSVMSMLIKPVVSQLTVVGKWRVMGPLMTIIVRIARRALCDFVSVGFVVAAHSELLIMSVPIDRLIRF